MAKSVRWFPITFERQEESEDFEDETYEWKEYIRSRAKITPLTGNELLNAQQINERVTHEVIARYQPEINSELRINYEGRIFHINSVINENEENRFIRMSCYESN